MTTSVRVARWAGVIIPVAIGVMGFLIGWLWPERNGSGAPAAEDPILFIVLAVFGASGWVIGTSAMFTLFRPPHRLPRGTRMIAAYVVRGFRGMEGLPESVWRDRPAVSPDHTSVSAARLLGLAFLGMPFHVALAPLLLGWLVRGDGDSRTLEVISVAAMAVAAAGWTAILALRARAEHRPPGR